MRVSSIIIGLILVGSIFTMMFGFARDLGGSDAYDVEISDEYEQAFDKTEEMNREINKSYNEIQEKWEGKKTSTLGFITLTIDAMVLVKNIIIYPFTVMGGMITSIIEYIKLPAAMQSMMLSISTILFIFAIVAIVLRYKWT